MSPLIVTLLKVVGVIAVLAAAYCLGAIPWSLIIGKRFFGVDLREMGSGNLGATNTFRNLGYRAGAAALLLDVGKGALAVTIAEVAVSAAWFGADVHSWVRVGAMLGAALGHSYSPYIRLRGGKGVAVSAGALFVLTPLAAVFELALFATVIALTRFVSLGSIIIAVVYPVLVVLLYPRDPALLVTIILLAALIVFRHRSNIVRIVRGEEPRLSFARQTQQHLEEDEGR